MHCLSLIPQAGLGVFPTTQSYWTGTHTAYTVWSGAQSNGYPYWYTNSSSYKTFGWYEIHTRRHDTPFSSIPQTFL